VANYHHNQDEKSFTPAQVPAILTCEVSAFFKTIASSEHLAAERRLQVAYVYT